MSLPFEEREYSQEDIFELEKIALRYRYIVTRMGVLDTINRTTDYFQTNARSSTPQDIKSLNKAVDIELAKLYKINKILFDADVMHISYLEDEYEAEAMAILRQASSAETVDELQKLIHSVFVEYFAAELIGDPEKFASIANELWEVVRPK